MSEFDIRDLFSNPWKEHNPLSVLGFDRQMVFELRRRPDIFDEVVRRMFRLRMIIFHPDHSANEQAAVLINRAMEYLNSRFYQEEILEEFLRQTSNDHRSQLVSAKRSTDAVNEQNQQLQLENKKLRKQLSEAKLAQHISQRRAVATQLVQQGFWVVPALMAKGCEANRTERMASSTSMLLPGFVVVEHKLLYIDTDRRILTLTKDLAVDNAPEEALNRYVHVMSKKIFEDERLHRIKERETEIRKVKAKIAYATIILEAESEIRKRILAYRRRALKGQFKSVVELRKRRWPRDSLSLVADVERIEKSSVVLYFADRLVYMQTKGLALEKGLPIEKAFNEIVGKAGYKLNAAFSGFREDQRLLVPSRIQGSVITLSLDALSRLITMTMSLRRESVQSKRFLGSLPIVGLPDHDGRDRLQSIDPTEVTAIIPGLHPQLTIGNHLVTASRVIEHGDKLRTSVSITKDWIRGLWSLSDITTRMGVQKKSIQLKIEEDEICEGEEQGSGAEEA